MQTDAQSILAGQCSTKIAKVVPYMMTFWANPVNRPALAKNKTLRKQDQYASFTAASERAVKMAVQLSQRRTKSSHFEITAVLPVTRADSIIVLVLS